jgi:O-methyltransferase domain
VTAITSDDGGDLDAAPDIFAAWMPSHVRLMHLVAAKWVTDPIFELTRLGVADKLADGACTAEELAASCGVLADPLRRLLRAAASVGVFSEQADGRFRLTPMAAHLCSEAELCLRDFALLLNSDPMRRSFGALPKVLETGLPGFEEANGVGFFDYLGQNPDLGLTYQRSWAPLTRRVANAAAAVIDLRQFSRVADLGGGNGAFLLTLLGKHSHLTGILMDQPSVLEAITPELVDDPHAHRLEMFPGYLPEQIPPDVDAYFIKNTLHCFEEGLVAETLRSIRRTIGGRRDCGLFLIESVGLLGNEYDWGKLIDIEVMVNCGGRVRTVEQWDWLLRACGFRLDNASNLLAPQWLLSASPS